MVSDTKVEDTKVAAKVLILVLMEYGLWQQEEQGMSLNIDVLILVLMEYGLWLSLEVFWWRLA